jgi:hypothetical protein
LIGIPVHRRAAKLRARPASWPENPAARSNPSSSSNTKRHPLTISTFFQVQNSRYNEICKWKLDILYDLSMIHDFLSLKSSRTRREFTGFVQHEPNFMTRFTDISAGNH